MWRVAIAVVALTWAGCLPSNRSSDFACSAQTDCDDGRICQGGYCIVQVCPEACDQCNVDEKTCTIDCESRRCNNLACPADYACDIRCGANQCERGIDCSAAGACAITCTGNNACGAITCGAGRCSVDCATTDSCGAVTCGTSCGCDVVCATGACPETTCPQNDTCTVDGTPATACISSTCGSC